MTKPLARTGSLDAPDEELARRAAKGDHTAFEALGWSCPECGAKKADFQMAVTA